MLGRPWGSPWVGDTTAGESCPFRKLITPAALGLCRLAGHGLRPTECPVGSQNPSLWRLGPPAAGGDLSTVVEMTTFHVDMGEHLGTFMKVKDEYMNEPYCAWTAIGCTELAMPGGLVEIRVQAHLG